MFRPGFTVIAALLAAAFSAPSGALAIDLDNEDSRAWRVQVTSKTMSRSVDLPARTGSIIVCVGECRFAGPGMGEVRASGDDVVAIRGGRLVVERAEARAASPSPVIAPPAPPVAPAEPVAASPRSRSRALAGGRMTWLDGRGARRR